MFFAWIALSLLLFSSLPWWGLFLTFAAVGFVRPGRLGQDALLGLASGGVAAAMGFYADGRSAGTIAPKIAALFSLPHPELIFAILFLMTFVSSVLALQTGYVLSRLFVKKAV